VAAEAEKWIRTAKAPWLVYVPFHAVHIPVDTPPEYKKIYEGVNFGETDPAKEESRHRFAAMVSQLDAKVGQLVAAVDQSGQRQNTIIVFTSDNGGLHSGGNGYVSKVPPTPVLSSNLPLRGQKKHVVRRRRPRAGVRQLAGEAGRRGRSTRRITSPTGCRRSRSSPAGTARRT
jgi:arylsulfatase A-like enzyme